MSQSHSDHIGAAVAKATAVLVGYISSWAATWSMADLEASTRIFSGLVIAVVGLLNGWVIYRDKIKRRPSDDPPTPAKDAP